MQKKKILMVDDDLKLTEIITKYFSQYEFSVTAIHDGKNIKDAVEAFKPDVMLLDVMLPDENGFDILKKLQNEVDLPIIMLTAKGDAVDRVIGLELGADDYITKPFSLRELLARIRTVLRRLNNSSTASTDKNDVEYKGFKLSVDKRSLIIDDYEEELTKTEFELLHMLAASPGKTYGREELLKVISDRDYEIFDRSIDMHISHLRSKLKKQNEPICAIKTVWGTGYRFEVSTD